MLIYRIEDKEQCGPFAGRDNVSEYYWDAFIHVSALPLPRHDGFKRLNIYRSKDTIVCGCNSVEELKEWFPYEVIQILDDYDYCLATYEVLDSKHFEIGGHQTIFKLKESVCVSRTPVYELYSEGV